MSKRELTAYNLFVKNYFANNKGCNMTQAAAVWASEHGNSGAVKRAKTSGLCTGQFVKKCQEQGKICVPAGENNRKRRSCATQKTIDSLLRSLEIKSGSEKRVRVAGPKGSCTSQFVKKCQDQGKICAPAGEDGRSYRTCTTEKSVQARLRRMAIADGGPLLRPGRPRKSSS